MEVNGQLHVPYAVPLGKESHYPLDRRPEGLRTGVDVVLEKKHVFAPVRSKTLILQLSSP
jgi:hypothetical protein